MSHNKSGRFRAFVVAEDGALIRSIGSGRLGYKRRKQPHAGEPAFDRIARVMRTQRVEVETVDREVQMHLGLRVR